MYCMIHIQNPVYYRKNSDIFGNIHVLFRHIQSYCCIFRTLWNRFIFRTLCHIQNPGIFRTQDIFRTLSRHILNFERNFDVLKSRNPCILLNKNIKFNKNETDSKMENPRHSFRETILVVSSYKSRKLKRKLWWIGARKRKKRTFFVPFILSEWNFFRICVLYTLLHIKKHIFINFCCLFLKSSKAFSVSLTFFFSL